MLGHGVDQLLEAPLGRNAELHAGQAVEHRALGSDLLDQLARPIEKGVGGELDRRDVVNRKESAPLHLLQIPAEALGDPAKLIGRLLQCEVDARLPAPHPLEEELQAEEGLAGPRRALDHGGAGARQPAGEHQVEPGDPGRSALGGRPGRRLLVGVRSAHAREEDEAVGTDLEEVKAGDDIRTAELENFDHPDRRQRLAAGSETKDAVGDGELGVLRDLLLGVFADEQRGGTPARGVHREIVDEGPHHRSLAEDVPHRLEAVDDDDGRLLLLHPLADRLECGAGVPAPDHRAQIDEDELLADQLLLEESELLHVLDQLERGLRERGEVDALLALLGEVEEDLKGEQRLARAGLSGDHGERSDRQPAAQDAIEGGAPGREAFQWCRAHLRSSGRPNRPRSRSSRICSRCWMTICPVISIRSGRSSATSSRSAGGTPEDGSFQAGGQL